MATTAGKTAQRRLRTRVELTAAARRLTPDVVLLDLQLPDTTGFAVAQELTGQDPAAPAIVITSTHDDEDFVDLVRER